MAYKDLEKKRQYEREWRKKNKDKVRKYRDHEKDRMYAKKYREKNKEKIKESWSTQEYKTKAAERHRNLKKSNLEYKERQKAANKQWLAKNKDMVREYRKNHHEKNKNNPQYKISKNLRGRIRDVLKKQAKSNKTIILLGCTVEFLISYLESKFLPGMSWENYGNPNGDHSDCWHIDHIKPCASFDLSNPEQQKECFHYTNLQPLWAIDNIKKGKKY